MFYHPIAVGFRTLGSIFSQKARARKPAGAPRAVLEPLEVRQLLSTVVQTINFPEVNTDWFATMSVNKFDTSLGTLTSIGIKASSTITSDIQVENISPNSPNTIHATVSGNVAVTGTDVSLPLAPIADAGTFNAPVFDGVSDFSGPSGHDFGLVSAMDMQSVTLTSAADLAAYSGIGTIDFSADAKATSGATDSAGSMLTFVQTTASASITVTYTYTIPVPPVGRMTGGGSVFLPAATAQNGVVGGPTGTRVTHGFELHCTTTALGANNHLEVNWGKPDQHFHLTNLDSVTCLDDPAIIPNQPPAPIDTLIGHGLGTYSGTFMGTKYNKAAATITFILTDAGEPGTKDTASYIVTLTSNGKIVLDTGDTNGDNARTIADYNLKTASAPVPPSSPHIPDQLFLTFGNQQAHKEIGKLTKTSSQIQQQINRTFSQLDNVNLTDSQILSLTQQLLTQQAQFEASLPV